MLEYKWIKHDNDMEGQFKTFEYYETVSSMNSNNLMVVKNVNI